MTGVEERAASVESAGREGFVRFVMTLIVATLITAVTAVVLSYAVLGPERVGHGSPALIHTAGSSA